MTLRKISQYLLLKHLSKKKKKGGNVTLKIQADDEDTQMRIVQSQVRIKEKEMKDTTAGLKTTASIKRSTVNIPKPDGSKKPD